MIRCALRWLAAPVPVPRYLWITLAGASLLWLISVILRGIMALIT